MTPLPPRANLDHLRKQAKKLLRRYRDGDRAAITRFARALPAAARRTDEEITALRLRLHDAQSCIAREYGFLSWADLSLHVEASAFVRSDQAAMVRRWLALAYDGDVTGTFEAAKPRVASRLLHDTPIFSRTLLWPVLPVAGRPYPARWQPIRAGCTAPTGRCSSHLWWQ
jgi:hypothetical protein